MTELPPRDGGEAGDAPLLERARAGDSDAFGELYRREVDPARRLARILVGEDGADELVAESFARVLAQLQAGRGPTEDFRAYLQVTIRNGFRDALRGTKESPSSDQPWLLDDVLPPVEELVEDLDRDVAVTALATLPKSWQQVLWHLEVEGRKPAEVAGILGMDAGAVSSLAYRAREGLKRAYLDQHFRPAAGGQCGWTQARMSQYVRGDLSPRAQQKVADHLDDCSACSAAYAAVDRVNQKLAAWLFPVVLWGLVESNKGGLLWIAGAAGAGGAGATGTPISSPTGMPAGAGANPAVVGAGAATVAVVAVGALVVALAGGGDDDDKDGSRDSAGSEAGPVDPGQPPGDRSTNRPQPPESQQREEPAVAPAEAPTSVAPSTQPPSGATDEPADDPTGGPTEPTDPTGPTGPPGTEPPPTTEPPAPVAVVPAPPVEVDITACGVQGSLDFARTEGVTYELTAGTGVEGPWTVVATADKGHVIAAGATTRFEGDLGTFYPCVRISDFDAHRHGPPLVTPWEFVTTLAVEGRKPATIDVVYDFTAPVFLLGQSAAGWRCDGVLNPLVALGRPVTCTYSFTGPQPPAVGVDALALLPAPNANPPGTVTIYSNGEQVDRVSF